MAMSWHEGYQDREEREQEEQGEGEEEELGRLDRRRNYSLKQLRPPHTTHQSDLRLEHNTKNGIRITKERALKKDSNYGM
jgi:hypothetical protein